MEVVLTFVFQYLEYIVAGLGGIGFIGYMKLKRINHYDNDLTDLIIEQKRVSDRINKRVKQ